MHDTSLPVLPFEIVRARSGRTNLRLELTCYQLTILQGLLMFSGTREAALLPSKCLRIYALF